MPIIERIVYKNRIFELNKPLRFVLDFVPENDLWTIECKKLGILVFDSDLEHAYERFGEEFAFLWDEYAEERDSGLTKDARELKNVLRRLVGSVS